MGGWAKLGEALAGVSPADRANIEAKTMNALATRDANVARARMAMDKARAQSTLGSRLGELGYENPDALADIAISGVNYNGLTSGIGNTQKQNFRQAAVDAAASGDWGGANAQMLGVASGPVEIPKVTGGMLLSNRLLPGGGDVSVTPVGASQILANEQRGQAALIRANRPSSSSANGSSGSGRLSQVQAARMKSELADIEAQEKIALGVLEANAGARNPASGTAVADAKATLAKLKEAKAAVFDKYEGAGSGSLGTRFGADTPGNQVNGVDIPQGFSQDQFEMAVAINLDRRNKGLPDLTEAQMQEIRRTGRLREPVAAPPKAAARQASIPAGAIQMLRSNPSLARQFEQKYGVSAADYLGK